ncbi:MAG: pectate lyase family protein [Planctomycetota bacterium]
MKERVKKFSVVVLMVLLGAVLANGGENKNPFAGESLPDGWTWKRANPEAWRLRNQGLEIKIEPGNMWGGNNDAKNVLLIPIAKDLLESGTDVHVTFENSPTNRWEQVDLVWYYRDSHMVKIGLELVNGKNSVVMGREEDDRTRTIKIVPIERDEVTVRLKVTGGQVRGYYRLTAEDNWTDVGICEEPRPTGSSDKPKVSIQCYQGDPQNPHWACITGLKIDSVTETKTIAFPGAEGAGKFTKGGRGGDVYHVTNLKDSGSGSLREGLETIKGPRTIVFDVGGMIRLKDKLVIQDKSYLTIAGQTAPGKGITLADQSLQIKECEHIIVRYLRVRLGDENKPAGSGPDCITVDHSDHIILDHLSLSWGIDGNGDFRGLKHTTLQWLIFSEALHDSLHGKGPHGMCTSFRDGQGPATMHHNIYASSRQRHPTINGGADVVEFCNNLDYNWQNGHNLSGDKFNLIGNYYKAGPSMRAGFRPIQLKTGKKPPTSQGYFAGNHFEGLPREYNKDNYTAMDYKASGLGFSGPHNYQDTTREKFEVSERFDAGKYKLTQIESAKDAYESCLKYSGCSLIRDTVDERFIKTIINNSGKIIDSQNDVGGWDLYPPIHRPDNWDTDHDGMADAWETANKLDPKKPEDRNGDADKDGYTNLEEYLNSLTPK